MPAVRTERSADGRIHTVILSRPEARNAVDRPTAEALHAAFIEYEKDATALCAVLFGEGGVFCAGADLKAVSASIGPTGLSSKGNRVVEPKIGEPLQAGPMGPTRLSLSKPVIAAVSGFAVAGGLELAVWCDLRVCDESAVFGVFCRRWGVPLVDGGTVRLPRLVGQGRAMDMILTGRPVLAAEAKAIGLADRVVPVGTVREVAEQFAKEIAGFPEQKCLRMDRKSSLDQWSLPSVEHALLNEYHLGRTVLQKSVQGAARFADGSGRGGSFDDFTRSRL